MSGTLLGPIEWGLEIDEEGHRNYTIAWKIETELSDDDPSVIANTAGIPVVGTTWTQLCSTYGFNGADDWAFCKPTMSVSPLDPKDTEPSQIWRVENLFSTKPGKRCQDNSIENPLLEPPDISGSFVKYRELPHVDRHGRPYRSSTGEPLVGQETERDRNRWEINIVINQLTVNLQLVSDLADYLNGSPMWGLPAETIKFSKFSFHRLLYGTCTFYYKLNYGFEIRADWTQYLADKGRMELVTGGSPTNPDHWRVAKDRYGENKPVLRLDVDGKPIVSDAQTPNTIVRKPYPYGNLLALGIPASW